MPSMIENTGGFGRGAGDAAQNLPDLWQAARSRLDAITPRLDAAEQAVRDAERTGDQAAIRQADRNYGAVRSEYDAATSDLEAARVAQQAHDMRVEQAGYGRPMEPADTLPSELSAGTDSTRVGEVPPRTVDEIQRGVGERLNAFTPDISGAATGAGLGAASGDEDTTPEQRAQRAIGGAVVGAVVGRRAGGLRAPNAMTEALPGLVRQLTPSAVVKVRGTPGQMALPTLEQSPSVLRQVADAVSPWTNRVNIVRYAGMLADTATHAFNAGSNVLLLGRDLATTPIAAGIDAARSILTGKPREAFFSEVPAQIAGMRAGATVGLQAAADIMRTGMRAEDAAKLDQATRGFGTNIPALAPAGSRRAGAVDFAFEYPLRALAAADAVFRSTALGGHLMAEATAAAMKANGGQAVTSEMVREAAKNPDLLTRVQELAARSVLQEDRALTSAYSRFIRQLGPAGAAVSIEIPFVKTPLNVIAQGLGMTPAGLAGLVQDVAEHRAPRQMEQRIAGVALGTAIMAGSAADYAAGNLTGPRPSDPKEASTLPPGWQPWSRKFTFPDGQTHYVSLSLAGPLALPAVVSILAGEAMKKGKDALSPEWAGQVAMGLAQYAEQQTFFQGVATIAQSVDPRTGAASLERNIEQIAAQFSPHVIGGGALGREIQRVMGMPQRDPAGAIEALLATHPATAGRVEPRQDVLGRPVVQGGGPLTAVVRAPVERDTGVIRAFRRAKEGLPLAAPKQITDPSTKEQRTLTPQQQHRWRRVFGAGLTEGWAGYGNPSDPETLRKIEQDARAVADETVLGLR
jgi:hypothetical protein